jgi:hypothetical protein
MPWLSLLILAVCGIVGYFLAGWKGAAIGIVGFIAGKAL